MQSEFPSRLGISYFSKYSNQTIHFWVILFIKYFNYECFRSNGCKTEVIIDTISNSYRIFLQFSKFLIRLRREARIKESYDRISATLALNDTKSTKNPTRIIPDIPGKYKISHRIYFIISIMMMNLLIFKVFNLYQRQKLKKIQKKLKRILYMR